jgi:NAD(P)-dependent dehydrogenase (short-subunit alcohol dehydrogenase family)
MSPSPVILVTGANRGIGFSIIRATALRVPNATYILACRSQSSGDEAVLELKKLGITATLDVLVLDITSDASILAAKETIEKKYGHLNGLLPFSSLSRQKVNSRKVLVNNAGIAIRPTPHSLPNTRDSFNTTFNTNVTSLYLLTTTLLPLLHFSPNGGKIINISSGRASLTRSQDPDFPPTAVLSYSISKAALSCLTIESWKAEEQRIKENGGKGDGKVEVYAVNPGHCKTALNGFRGTRDPLEGAEIVVCLVTAESGTWRSGSFLEEEGCS